MTSKCVARKHQKKVKDILYRMTRYMTYSTVTFCDCVSSIFPRRDNTSAILINMQKLRKNKVGAQEPIVQFFQQVWKEQNRQDKRKDRVRGL